MTPWRPIYQERRLSEFGDLLSGNCTTTTAVAVVCATYSPPNSSTTYISATIAGRRTDGFNVGDAAVLTITCCYKKDASGVLTQIGADTAAVPYASASVNAAAASSSSAAGVISILATGVAAATVNWVCQSAFTGVAQ